MAIKYIPYYPNTLEGQALLDNFVRTKRILRYHDNGKVVERIERGMPLYEMELTEKVGTNSNENLIIRGECVSACAYLKDKGINVDLVYIDPPYNSRQYCDAYHLIENVARWQQPDVSGVAKKPDRSAQKSEYCTKQAEAAFEDLISHITAKYILLSYNNMANKGNDRSNAKISDEVIMKVLGAKGTVEIFSESYKAFTTGKSNIEGNEERLFLCRCI